MYPLGVHSTRIAVVGSLMLDITVRAPRLPQVGESLTGYEAAMFVGGKGGNQAIAAARAGAGHVTMVGRLGADGFGERILAALKEDGVACEHVRADASVGTGVAIPMVFDDGANSIIAIPNANLAMTAADVHAAKEALTGADLVLVQFEVAMEAVEAAIALAHAAGVRVILNPAPMRPYSPALLRQTTILVANEIEAAALVPAAEGDHAEEGWELLARGPAAVIITLGAEGALVTTQEGQEFVPPFRVASIDSVGAGDAFCGALAAALAEGQPLLAACRFASAAGALCAARPGAAASLPTRTEIEALLGR